MTANNNVWQEMLIFTDTILEKNLYIPAIKIFMRYLLVKYENHVEITRLMIAKSLKYSLQSEWISVNLNICLNILIFNLFLP